MTLPTALVQTDVLRHVLAMQQSATPAETEAAMQSLSIIVGAMVEAGILASGPARSHLLGTALAVGLSEDRSRACIARFVPGPNDYVPAEPIGVRSASDAPALQESIRAQLRELPAEGRWEYKTVPLSEMAGFATAKGTAGRLEELLNGCARDGWELVFISDRESRWMQGETLIVTFRRYVVTEESYRKFLEARAEIQRTVDSNG